MSDEHILESVSVSTDAGFIEVSRTDDHKVVVSVPVGPLVLTHQEASNLAGKFLALALKASMAENLLKKKDPGN